MKKKALITGITGQDGSYLAEFLLKKGYEVHGIVRRVALENQQHRLWRIKKILKKFKCMQVQWKVMLVFLKYIIK